jgi:RNA polymerase sigma factor (sigma-70 family)
VRVLEQPWSQQSDTHLVGACLDGREDAWHALIARYKRLVFSIPIKKGIPHEDAVDIFQAVWVDCFQNLASLRDMERVQPWLIRITVRKCYRFLQDRHSPTEVAEAEAQEEAASDVASDALLEQLEREQVIRNAIETLTPRCREVITLLFYEDPRPSYQAIATRLGLSANSIGFTRERCLKCLKDVLGSMGYAENGHN